MMRLAMLSILVSAVLFQISNFAWENAAMNAHPHQFPIGQTALFDQSMLDGCGMIEDGLKISTMCLQVDCLTGHCSVFPANVTILADEGFTPDRSFKLHDWFRLYESDRAPPFRPPVKV